MIIRFECLCRCWILKRRVAPTSPTPTSSPSSSFAVSSCSTFLWLWSWTTSTTSPGGQHQDPGVNQRFLRDFSQMWVGGVADSQTRSTPQNLPKSPEFHLSFSQISQKPWGRWVGKQIWERSPKKNLFFISSLTRDSSILGAHHLDEFIRIWAE